MNDANPPISVLRVVKHLPDRGLQPVVAAISVHAGVISKALGVSSATDLVVGLIEISEAGDQIAFLVAFKAGSRHDVEDSVGAVAVIGVVAAALNFQIIDIFGIDLRAQIAGDVGVGDGHAVNQPVDLVASAHVQHVVGHIGAGT